MAGTPADATASTPARRATAHRARSPGNLRPPRPCSCLLRAESFLDSFYRLSPASVLSNFACFGHSNITAVLAN
ncbi:hypothetical protein V5799_013759 [Amblyomma americanum]|uniref:Uncharacterized protein n=1 Tax=Amblyomma americanum TaxID=6943 RepID=A0AAQ4E4Z1_AMBAM